MARITLRQLLDHAAEQGYGVPAFNINNMEQGLAIMEAAEAVDAPVIIQASRGARSYANDIVLKHIIDACAEMYPHIPICMLTGALTWSAASLIARACSMLLMLNAGRP